MRESILTREEKSTLNVCGIGGHPIFSYFAREIGLTMKGALHAKTVTIRYAGGAASYHCQGERETNNL
jgi:hypothetical protein